MAIGKSGTEGGLVVVGCCAPSVSSLTRSDRKKSRLVMVTRPFAAQIGFAFQAFQQRFGECAMPPFDVFQSGLFAGRSGEDDGSVFCAGEFVEPAR